MFVRLVLVFFLFVIPHSFHLFNWIMYNQSKNRLNGFLWAFFSTSYKKSARRRSTSINVSAHLDEMLTALTHNRCLVYFIVQLHNNIIVYTLSSVNSTLTLFSSLSSLKPKFLWRDFQIKFYQQLDCMTYLTFCSRSFPFRTTGRI